MSNKTYKQITYGIAAIYILFFIFFIVYDIALRPSTEVTESPPGRPKAGWAFVMPMLGQARISVVWGGPQRSA